MFIRAASDAEGFTITAFGPELAPGTMYDVRTTVSDNDKSFPYGVGGASTKARAMPQPSTDGIIVLTNSYQDAEIGGPGWVKAWLEPAGSDPTNPSPIAGLEVVFAVAPAA